MSTRVQYIFTSSTGELATVEIDCPKSDQLNDNYDAWCLSKIRGPLKDQVEKLQEQGYYFSNWHFITSDRHAQLERRGFVVFHHPHTTPAHVITTSKTPKRVYTNAFPRNKKSVRGKLSGSRPSSVDRV